MSSCHPDETLRQKCRQTGREKASAATRQPGFQGFPLQVVASSVAFQEHLIRQPIVSGRQWPAALTRDTQIGRRSAGGLADTAIVMAMSSAGRIDRSAPRTRSGLYILFGAASKPTHRNSFIH